MRQLTELELGQMGAGNMALSISYAASFLGGAMGACIGGSYAAPLSAVSLFYTVMSRQSIQNIHAGVALSMGIFGLGVLGGASVGALVGNGAVSVGESIYSTFI